MTLEHNEMAAAVVEELRSLDTGNWAIVQADQTSVSYRTRIRDHGGLVLSFGQTGRCWSERKWHISHYRSNPEYHKDYPSSEGYTLDINCGLSKTPKQVAKDIVRRLLPDARRYVADAKERKEVRVTSEDAHLALGLEAALAFAGRVEDIGCHVRMPYASDRPYGELEVSTYGYPHADITLKRVPMELVAALGAAWKAWLLQHPITD